MTVSFDFATLDGPLRYKLLCGLVVPRPIALITTISAEGVVNAAPFSFFNVFSEAPPLVVVGLQTKPDLTMKDTTRNVRANGNFVINMVDEGFVHNMVDCSIGFPSGLSEPEQLGLSLGEGKWQPVPHLAGAPVALECRKVTMMNFGAERDLLVGEVLGIQVREGIVDPVTLRTSYDNYQPVARIAGTMYARMLEHYDIKPDSYESWLQREPR